jgi:hypothetical protein
MRVRISYAVDVEDIPTEVNKLYNSIKLNLEAQIKSIDWAITDMNSEKSYSSILERVDNIRRQLFKADSKLDDSIAILKGYQQIKASPKLAEEPQEESPIE